LFPILYSIHLLWTLYRSQCSMGFDCCGYGANRMAVYRNPDLLGCYEPPMPGPTNDGESLYPQPCRATYTCPVKAVTRSPWAGVSSGTGTTALMNIVATAAPQAVFGNASHPNYVYIGCYTPGSLTSVFFSGPMGHVTGFNQYGGGNEYGCQEICSKAKSGAASQYAAVFGVR
jgi:hypothetical protein